MHQDIVERIRVANAVFQEEASAVDSTHHAMARHLADLMGVCEVRDDLPRGFEAALRVARTMREDDLKGKP